MALVQRVACDLSTCSHVAEVEERKQGRGTRVTIPEDWITVKASGSEFHLSTWDCLSQWTDEQVLAAREDQQANGRARPVQRQTSGRRPGE